MCLSLCRLGDVGFTAVCQDCHVFCPVQASWCRLYSSVPGLSCHFQNKIQTQKGSNECLFILTRTHSTHIFIISCVLSCHVFWPMQAKWYRLFGGVPGLSRVLTSTDLVMEALQQCARTSTCFYLCRWDAEQSGCCGRSETPVSSSGAAAEGDASSADRFHPPCHQSGKNKNTDRWVLRWRRRRVVG